MTGGAGAIDLPGGNSCEPDLRPFGAPDRTVAIPDGNGGTGEDLSRSNDGKKGKHQTATRTSAKNRNREANANPVSTLRDQTIIRSLCHRHRDRGGGHIRDRQFSQAPHRQTGRACSS